MKLYSAAQDFTVSPQAHRIAELILTCRDREGVSRVDTKNLMKKTGWKEGKIDRYRSEAVKRGYLRKVFFKGSGGKFGKGSVGFLAGPKLLKSPAVGTKNSDTDTHP